MRTWPIFLCLLFVSSSSAQPAQPGPAGICSIDELLHLNECQLLELYKSAQSGPVPTGFWPGRTIPHPGSRSTVARSNLMKHVWQGKYFDDDVMTNRFFGMKIIKGQVGLESSWIDGKPAHSIDYSGTSFLFKPYRDEFREIAPRLYLGTMWKRDDCKPKLLTWFAIDGRCSSPCQ